MFGFGFDACDIARMGVKVDEKHVPIPIRRLERHIDSNYAAKNDAIKVVSDLQFVCWKLAPKNGRCIAIMVVSTSEGTSSLSVYEDIPQRVWLSIEGSLPMTEVLA